MIRAVLFDLDDTLLGNDMNVFMASYLPLLAGHVQSFIDPGLFATELMIGTRAMIENEDPATTNQEAFWSVFSTRTGLEREVMESYINAFYRTRFRELRPVTKKRAVARSLVEFCFNHDLKVAIATNPLFPLSAIEQRLDWAGISVEEFEYDLVTGYENMHATKPNPAYYQEILNHLEVIPQQALMVGNEWDNDILPAHVLGISTFWISNEKPLGGKHAIAADNWGTLEAFYERFQSGWLLR